jgi:hypothetical protein
MLASRPPLSTPPEHFLHNPVPEERAILTPSQLNAVARDLLEGAFPLIWVEGELSGV